MSSTVFYLFGHTYMHAHKQTCLYVLTHIHFALSSNPCALSNIYFTYIHSYSHTHMCMFTEILKFCRSYQCACNNGYSGTGLECDDSKYSACMYVCMYSYSSIAWMNRSCYSALFMYANMYACMYACSGSCLECADSRFPACMHACMHVWVL
jgi:hypothetical protein